MLGLADNCSSPLGLHLKPAPLVPGSLRASGDCSRGLCCAQVACRFAGSHGLQGDETLLPSAVAMLGLGLPSIPRSKVNVHDMVDDVGHARLRSDGQCCCSPIARPRHHCCWLRPLVEPRRCRLRRHCRMGADRHHRRSGSAHLRTNGANCRRHCHCCRCGSLLGRQRTKLMACVVWVAAIATMCGCD